MTFGPRPCCRTSAATQAPATVGAPSVTLSPADPSVYAGNTASYTMSVTDNDSSGCAASTYQLSSIAPGSYGVSITSAFYDAFSASGIVVLNAATTTYNITLTQTPGTLQGVVTDNAVPPVPISGATVALSGGATATSDSAGRYTFSSLTPGVYSATASAATYNGATASGISIPNGGSTTRNFSLSPIPGTLQGVVTDAATMQPIAGATVRLSTGASALTSTTGSYSIASIAPGTYTATVSAATYASSPARSTPRRSAVSMAC